MLVEKKHYKLQGFSTFNGQVIPEINIGWESWGTLNAQRDNVILVTHYFSGSSHAAGRYQEDDLLAGYWDSIIGSGKPLDTDKYFIISSDTLVNQEPFNPNVITTGPATINPATGKSWGLDFPVVTIRDFVEVQRSLLLSLGIETLHAVIGPSMGSLQALEWSIAYPAAVKRMISVIGMGEADAWSCLGLQQWAEPILNDPLWCEGDYAPSKPPAAGVQQTLMQISLAAMSPTIINRTFKQHEPLETAPLTTIRQNFRIVDYFKAQCLAQTKYADANHLLYLIRANQLFIAGHAANLTESLQKIQAKCLFLPATNDLLLFPEMSQRIHQTLIALGKNSSYTEINGDWGHLDGVNSITNQAETLRQFINQD